MFAKDPLHDKRSERESSLCGINPQMLINENRIENVNFSLTFLDL